MSTINSWHQAKAPGVAGAKAAAEEVEPNQLVVNKVNISPIWRRLVGDLLPHDWSLEPCVCVTD